MSRPRIGTVRVFFAVARILFSLCLLVGLLLAVIPAQLEVLIHDYSGELEEPFPYPWSAVLISLVCLAMVVFLVLRIRRQLRAMRTAFAPASIRKCESPSATRWREHRTAKRPDQST